MGLGLGARGLEPRTFSEFGFKVLGLGCKP